MSDVPDYPLGETLNFKFTTRAFATGLPTTLAGSPVVEVYEDNSVTQITVGETLTVDFDSKTGLNNLRIVATSGNGYESGKSYAAIISTGTVGGVSVVGEVVQQFSIERSPALRPTTAGRTLTVEADGMAHADVKELAGDTIQQTSGYIEGTIIYWGTNGQGVGYSGTTNLPQVDTASISDDSTAANNLELQYDTTGLSGDTFPATQAQVGSIGVGSGALNKETLAAPVVAYGDITGAYTATQLQDGSYQQIAIAAGEDRLEAYYVYQFTGNERPIEVDMFGRYHEDNNDKIVFSAYAYNWTSSAAGAGTVSVNNGATTVTGAGTDFQTDFDDQDHIYINGVVYTVDGEPASATSLEILPVFQSANDTGMSYAIGVWDKIGDFEGKKNSAAKDDKARGPWKLLTRHIGTGNDLGKTFVRLAVDGRETEPAESAELFTDLLLVAYTNVNQSVGYADGAVWVDSAGTAGSEDYVNGTADNPCPWADALVVAASIGLKRFHIANDVTIELLAAFEDKTMYGDHYYLNLSGESINDSAIIGATINGTGVATGHTVFTDCEMLADSSTGPGKFDHCGFNTPSGSPFVAASNGEYLLVDCYSLVAGSATPYLDFSGTGATTGVNIRRWSGGTNITLDSDNSLSLEVVTGGGQTITTGGANVEIRAMCRAVTVVMSAAETVQFVGVTGPITLSGTTTGNANLYGVASDVTDTRSTKNGENKTVSRENINAECDTANADYGANTTTPPTAAAIVNEWETQSQADPTGFHVNVMEVNGTAQTANDNGADINAILVAVGTTLEARFTGITSLADWLGFMMGKASDASTKAEFNARTASANVDNTDDSLEAQKDAGYSTFDASSDTVTLGGGTHGSGSATLELNTASIVGGLTLGAAGLTSPALTVANNSAIFATMTLSNAGSGPEIGITAGSPIDMLANITGDLTGDHIGDHTGNTTGATTGNRTGSVSSVTNGVTVGAGGITSGSFASNSLTGDAMAASYSAGVSAACWDAQIGDYGIGGSYGVLIETYLDAAVSTAGGDSAATIWAYGTRVLTAGTNLNDLSAAGVAAAVWNAATATYGSAGSYGLLVETNLDAQVSAVTTSITFSPLMSTIDPGSVKSADLTIYYGEEKKPTIIVTDVNGDAVDVSGKTLTLKVYEQDRSTHPPTNTSKFEVENDNLTVGGSGNNEVSVDSIPKTATLLDSDDNDDDTDYRWVLRAASTDDPAYQVFARGRVTFVTEMLPDES